jgi:hypothetical protein
MPELITRRAPLAHSTFNRETRTVEAILSAGSDVERRDARGSYIERLSLAGVTVRDGADRVPLLDGHNRSTIGALLGYADAIRVADGEVRATLHVADDRALNLIEGGALTGVSIGYLPAGEEWRQEGGRRIRSLTPVIHEASLTAFPADPSAAILRTDNMDTTIDTNDRAETNAQIRTIGQRAGIATEFIDSLIDRSATLEQARSAMFDELTRRHVHIPAYQIGASGDDPGVIVARMQAALAHRLGAPGELPAEAVQYRAMGLHDMARSLLAARGERVLSMPVEEMLQRAITTSDLPTLLQGTGQRTLMAAYQPALSPLFRLARQSTANDFRTKTLVRLGELELLAKVAEHGEVTHGGVAEAAESYAMATYAKMFSLSRQAIINDDLGAFGTITAAMGRAAAETQNNLIVTLFTQSSGLGPTMGDGVRLFNSAHGNLAGSGGAIDATTLAAGVLALRTQKGVDGVSPINVTPRYLLAPAGKETAARQGVASFYPATSANVNPLAGTLEVLIEPRLSGNAWYLFADPAVMPTLEYSYLSSAPGPQLSSREGWDVLGMEFRVVLDFGSGAVDWRGVYRNPGA